jgi:hypothetical protein
MGSNHDSCQLNKFVYWRSTYSLSVPNKGSKNDFRQQEILVLSLDLHPICAAYDLETYLAPTEKIRAMAFDLELICA